MNKLIRAAGIQLAPHPDREKNLSRTKALAAIASDQGASIIALPQLFSSPWFPSSIDERNLSLAEEEDGPTVSFIRELASEIKAVVIAPVFEKDGDVRFNTAFVIGADGGVVGKYRKMHVANLPLWEEKPYFSPGNMGFPVFRAGGAAIGVQLCRDIFFPEGFRVLALKGAEIVFAPTASAFYHSRKKWDSALSAAAHANGLFIFRVNRIGAEGAQEFYGRSFCVNPEGEFIAGPSGSSEGVVVADIDLNEVHSSRSEWAFLKDRRPDEYGRISKDSAKEDAK